MMIHEIHDSSTKCTTGPEKLAGQLSAVVIFSMKQQSEEQYGGIFPSWPKREEELIICIVKPEL
jgi:hypothetical protein